MEQQCGFIRALHSFFWLLCWSFQLQSGLDRNLAHPLHANSNAIGVLLVRSKCLPVRSKKCCPFFNWGKRKGIPSLHMTWSIIRPMNFLTPAGYLFLGFRLKNFGTPKHIQDDLPQGDPRLLRSKALHLFRAPNGHRWYLPCWTRLPIMGHAMPAYIGEINSEHIGLARAGFRSPSQCNGGKVSGLLQKSWNPSGKLTKFYWWCCAVVVKMLGHPIIYRPVK